VLSWHEAQLLKYCATPALSDCGAAATRHAIAEVNARSQMSRLMVFMVRKIISICQDSPGVNNLVLARAFLDTERIVKTAAYLLCSLQFFKHRALTGGETCGDENSWP
jgi:hypothetical protein